MADVVKLLTEAEWNHIWAQANNKTPAQMREYLRERGLIASEPDPKAGAVREISEARGITGASNNVSIRADVYRCDLADAFERGMEMRPPLTREMVREAVIAAGHVPDRWHVVIYDRLHAALTKEQS